MLLLGHDTPDMKRKGTDVNTTRSMTFSRCLTMNEKVMAKKMQARRYGMVKSRNSPRGIMCTKLKIRGIANNTHADSITKSTKNHNVLPTMMRERPKLRSSIGLRRTNPCFS